LSETPDKTFVGVTAARKQGVDEWIMDLQHRLAIRSSLKQTVGRTLPYFADRC